MNEKREPAHSFHEGSDGGPVLRSDDQITLPVPGLRSIEGVNPAFVDRARGEAVNHSEHQTFPALGRRAGSFARRSAITGSYP